MLLHAVNWKELENDRLGYLHQLEWLQGQGFATTIPKEYELLEDPDETILHLYNLATEGNATFQKRLKTQNGSELVLRYLREYGFTHTSLLLEFKVMVFGIFCLYGMEDFVWFLKNGTSNVSKLQTPRAYIETIFMGLKLFGVFDHKNSDFEELLSISAFHTFDTVKAFKAYKLEDKSQDACNKRRKTSKGQSKET
jgi:hypothetical protein